MLSSLAITNYALIDRLEVDFSPGFSVITGETGAGKSILLGALSLALGKRADLSSLRDPSQKSIVEASFEISDYALEAFFEQADLDYEPTTLIRREILASGKSRAFVNDTPVTLDVLSQLGAHLVDIHSQHQTLLLGNSDFQFKVVDALAGNQELLQRYRGDLRQYHEIGARLQRKIAQRDEALKEQDYNNFLLQELQEAQLQPGEQEELEQELEELSHVEAIQEHLSKGIQLLEDENMGVQTLVAELRQTLSKISGFGPQYQNLVDRVQSLGIELDDLASEQQNMLEGVEADPQRLEIVNAKLQLINTLLNKHLALDIAELLDIQAQLTQKVDTAAQSEEEIEQLKQQRTRMEGQLESYCGQLRNQRQKALPELKKALEDQLAPLGMPNATFLLQISPAMEFDNHGKDHLEFLFSANKGSKPNALGKVASGGELSRIMLVIKSILAQHGQLPTMMFDEIDTGVSGEVSSQMGQIMGQMGTHMQLFAITHLPQVASQGQQHYKVYKEEQGGQTLTGIKQLSQEERVKELAAMLGGNQLTESALAHARQLLE